MTSRVELLRTMMRSTKPIICTERARLYTEAFQKNFLNPPILQNAKAFEYYLDNCSFLINEGELIIGNIAEHFRGIPIFPEWSSQWIIDEWGLFETRSTDPVRLPETKQEQDLLQDICRLWSGTTFEDHCMAEMDEDVLAAERIGVMTVGCKTGSTCEVLPDFRTLMEIGLRGLIKKAEGKLAEFKSEHRTDELQEKINFERAVIITLEAVIRYANRFAVYAESLAEQETDSKRKEELNQLAQICRHVPENPPRTFHEGLQFVWFIHLLEHLEDNSHGNSVARFDQYMFPLYDNDLKTGRITRDDAVELLELFFIKFNEMIKIRNAQDSVSFAGYPMWQNLMIGGYDRNLEDITNDLSFAVLDAAEGVSLVQPSVSLQLHRNTPDALMKRAVAMTHKGLAMPAYYNAELITDLVLQKGATLVEAREYSIEGCTEVYSDGNSNGRPSAGYINALKLLELALNDGVDPVTKEKIGAASGDPSTFTCIEDVWAAFEMQLVHFTEVLTRGFNTVGAMHSTLMCIAYNSSFIGDCIEKASAAQQHGAKYSYSGVFITGSANVSDSLAALKKAVFDEKKFTITEINEMLEKNFEGHERERQYLLNKCPKFGNDIDEVDAYSRNIGVIYRRELDSYRDNRGGLYEFAFLSSSNNVWLGKASGASPCGRLAGAPLADNGSPVAGRDTSGPTANIKSMSKLDQRNATTGTLYNIKFDPAIIKGEPGIDILESIIKTYFDIDGEHIQINIVDEETLRDAQRNPSEYANLMVRVAGYSAYFIELNRDVQEALIARTAHTSGS